VSSDWGGRPVQGSGFKGGGNHRKWGAVSHPRRWGAVNVIAHFSEGREGKTSEERGRWNSWESGTALFGPTAGKKGVGSRRQQALALYIRRRDPALGKRKDQKKGLSSFWERPLVPGIKGKKTGTKGPRVRSRLSYV